MKHDDDISAGQGVLPRLCSEIRLFDLCERESCTMKEGRFCTDPQLLLKFEAIAEKDETAGSRYDDGEGSPDDGDFEDCEYEGEDAEEDE